MKIKTILKTIIIILSIIFGVYIIASGQIKEITSSLGEVGIFGVFIAGALYGYALTAAPAVAALIVFTNSYNPLIIAFIGAIGTMAGDYLIFHIIRDKLPKKSEKLFKLIGVKKLRELKKSKYSWLLPLITGIIIASPLPDEVGVSLLGITHYNLEKFLLLSFILNFIGILIITGIVWII